MMNKLEAIGIFINYVADSFPEIKETEETRMWEREALEKQGNEMLQMDDVSRPVPANKLESESHVAWELDIVNISDSEAQMIYLQGLKDSFNIMKNMGVIKL